MKTTLSICILGLAALLGGTAMAGEKPHPGGPPDVMHDDTDGDGRVSRAEATAASNKRSGEWFDKLDQNKDGYVTKDELKQARATRNENRDEMKGKAKEHFKEADANGDGQLSLDEAQAKMPRVAERFNDLDADKNGLLTKEELRRGGPPHGDHPKGKRPEPAN
jgi:hypothetical protein